jgi:hypothetical protein
MKTLCLILLVILSGCSQVETVKPLNIAFIQEKDLFYTKSQLAFIKDAVDCSNKITKAPEFKAAVLGATYEQTTDTPQEIFVVMTSGAMSEVRPIYPKNPWSALTATTFANDPAIYLNARRARSRALWVGSILHEHSHHRKFTHRGNQRKGNEKSVPYVFTEIGEKLAYLCK